MDGCVMVIVTIGGDPGSGKSTMGKLLAARLQVPFFSMGTVRREFGLARGMTLAQLNAWAEHDPASDRLVDEYQRELPQRHHSFVIDSRLGFHFIPQAVKIYVKVDVHEAARRILESGRTEERWADVDEGVSSLRNRLASDRKRYGQLYGIDHTDLAHYDLVLDSSATSPLELLEQVLAFLKRRGIPVPRSETI